MSIISDLHNAKLAKNNKATFTIIERQIDCPRSFQFYIDTGSTKDGPWVRVGINNKEYVAGFTTKRIEASYGEDEETTREEKKENNLA